MAQKTGKQVSRAQAKSLMLKQQKRQLTDPARFREEPIPAGMARIILEAHDVWGDGSGYQMLLDADHTAYGNEIPLPTPLGNTLTVDCAIPPTLYAPFEFKVPADADPSCTPDHQVVDGVAVVDIPAGVYDYVVVNPTPALCIVIPGIFGQEDDTFGNDVRFEAGKIYHFLVSFKDDGAFQDTGDYVTMTVTEPEPFQPVQNLSATVAGNTVRLSWDAPATRAPVLQEDFENGFPNGWTSIDADNDGYGWEETPAYLMGHDSNGSISSRSWVLEAGALTPDNYLVTPELNLDGIGNLSFWIRSPGGISYVSEHYAVYASSGGNTVSDFTVPLLEETTTSKSVEAAARTGSGKGEWYKKSVTLPAGTKYVAFRHFNSTDQLMLSLDDVIVSNEGNTSVDYSYTIYRDGTKIEEGLTGTTFEEETTEGTHSYCVEVQYANGVSPQACQEVTVNTGQGEWAPVQNLSVSVEGQKVTLKWDSPTSGKSTTVLNESFDKENLPDGWSMIDADGDGHNWMSTIGVYNTLPHSGAGAMFSKSWTSKPDLTPDNYLVTPRFTVPVRGELTYWVSTQEEWVNENYGVFLSVSGNQATDFTENLFEENLSNGKPVTIRQKRDETPKLPAPYRKRSIDLSAYAGQEVYLAFRHFNSEGVFRFYLDDVTISEGEVSEEYTYTVYRDGTKIKEGLTETAFEEETVAGIHNYCVEVQYTNGVSPQVCQEVTVNTGQEEWPPVQNLSGSVEGQKVTLKWDVPQGNTPISSEIVLSENFDSFDFPTGWTRIDADGDGHNWETGYHAPNISYGHNGSTGMIASVSFINYVGPLTPDNYLITPELNLPDGGTLTFWVCAQDANYAAEHYAVYASSSGNTTADFTAPLFEETLSSKDDVQASDNIRGTRVQGQWYQRTVQLPAGTKYVAFRHFDCTNQYWIDLDDVEIRINTKCRSMNNRKERVLLSVTDAPELLRSGEAEIVLEAHNVWNDGSDYQILLDADHDQYGQVIPESSFVLWPDCTVPTDLYAPFEHKVPVGADPSCTPGYMVMDGSSSVKIPAGTYDYVIAAPQAGVKVWIAGQGPTKGNDYVFEAGKRYHFLMQMMGMGDGTDLTVEENVIPDYTYTVYRDGTKIEEGLTASLFEEDGVSAGIHEYCVEVQYADGVSPKACVNVDVTGTLNPVTDLTATQDGDDVILQWKAPASKDNGLVLSEDFEAVAPDAVPAGWSVIDADGDGRNWGGLSSVHVFNYELSDVS